MTNSFAREVEEGLCSQPKRISSRFFYDDHGSDLFVQITQTPEYYLTNSEREIFETQARDIIKAFQLPESSFDLVELGAGDGSKTFLLLEVLRERNFCYVPIDISLDALQKLSESVKSQFPNLRIDPIHAEYFDALKRLPQESRKAVLFLGSNLGNLSDERANEFLSALGSLLQEGDSILLGLDLIKSEAIVLPAYNDAQGITKAFNLNLLTRINRELGGNFNLNNWDHLPEYSQKEGIARSSLVSLQNQTAEIKDLNRTFEFLKGEKIHTEISRKYNREILQKILSGTGLVMESVFTYTKKYFANFLLRKQAEV